MSFRPEYIRQTNRTQRPIWFWLSSIALALSLLILIVAAPIAVATNHPRLAFVIYHSFSPICHQLAERSFFIAGHQFAVCARCTGLYSGFTLMLVLYPLFRSLRSTQLPRVMWLFYAAVPLLIDFSLTFMGIWENTHSSRLLTGMLLGGTTVFYVVPGIVELSLRYWPTDQASPKTTTFTMVSAESLASAPSDYSAPERRI